MLKKDIEKELVLIVSDLLTKKQYKNLPCDLERLERLHRGEVMAHVIQQDNKDTNYQSVVIILIGANIEGVKNVIKELIETHTGLFRPIEYYIDRIDCNLEQYCIIYDKEEI